jgi:hypothetical protein
MPKTLRQAQGERGNLLIQRLISSDFLRTYQERVGAQKSEGLILKLFS